MNFIEHRCAADDQHPFQSGWLMMSDVCKHCHNAPCLEACPTGALFRTEFDTVVVQQDICNGCGYCVPACPFGVIDISSAGRQGAQVHVVLRSAEGRAGAGLRQGLPNGLHPVRRTGGSAERAPKPGARQLHQHGVPSAYLYGAPGAPGATGGWNTERVLPADRTTRDVQSPSGTDSARQSRGAEFLTAGSGAMLGLAPSRPRRSADSSGGRRMLDVSGAGDWDGGTYYGREQVKAAPFKNWLVGSYIFAAGLSGGAAMLSAVMDLVRGDAAERNVRRGRWLSLLAPTLGTACLIADLHTPKRFYNMLRLFKLHFTDVHRKLGPGRFRFVQFSCRRG